MERRVAPRPWPPFTPGETLRIDRRTVWIDAIVQRIERQGDDLRHIVELYPRGRLRKRPRPAPNVIDMPLGDDSTVAEFLRYHVLVRVYGGDADAWLAHLREHGDAGGNLRFVHWIRSRLRHDPTLLAAIRQLVEATPFRLSAGAGRL